MTDQLGVFPHGMDRRRQTMRTPDEVAAMLRLHNLGGVAKGSACAAGGKATQGGARAGSQLR